MNPLEAQIRSTLGIPDPSVAKQALILGSTAHLDWDWLNVFLGYYTTSNNYDGYVVHDVRTIFQNATTYLGAYGSAPFYYYSIAEIAYLKQFAGDQPQAFAALQQLGGLLRIVGGGVTSPDNLLPNGETLLRTFLIANAWVLSQFPATGPHALPPLRQAWVPDDFGHDSQFPVLLEAMGLQGVGFSRIPGDPQQYGVTPFSGGPQMAAWLLAMGDEQGRKGVDFVWRAADGSEALAHFMQAAYYQGQNITGADALEQMQICYTTNQPASPTPYVFVPVGNDFSLPAPDLVQSATAWNQQGGYPSGQYPDVYAIAATFDDYMQLVGCYRDQLFTRTYQGDQQSGALTFQPTPYWTGHYGSRPALKILHHQAAALLLGAEALAAIGALFGLPAPGALADGWWALAPSTHHDYITGTAANVVCGTASAPGEQLTDLSKAVALGQKCLGAAMGQLAANIASAPGDGTPITVFNTLGFPRGGLVVMQPIAGVTPASFGTSGVVLGPVQASSDGEWLFVIPDGSPGVPGIGYGAFELYPAGGKDPPATTLSITMADDGSSATLANDCLTATISAAAGWGVESLTTADGAQVLAGPGNLLLYNDDSQGDMYKFGSEIGAGFSPEQADFTATSVTIVERGPVRVRLSVVGTYTVAGAPQTVTREYMLVTEESFLRMATQGSAPNPYSVFVSFPFAQPGALDALIHGTPYHWDAKPAFPIVNQDRGWTPPTFEATHRFVIPAIGGASPGAIYHAHLPAWAVSPDGSSLLGCLLRNPNNQSHNGVAGGPGDPDAHTLLYALRGPGAGDPTTGAPLCESLAFETPLAAMQAGGGSGALPAWFGLASLSDPAFVVGAAKPGEIPGQTEGQIVLRIYQPTNSARSVTLTLPDAPDGKQWAARGVTALETPLDPAAEARLQLQVNGNQVTFVASRALTTLAVGWS